MGERLVYSKISSSEVPTKEESSFQDQQEGISQSQDQILITRVGIQGDEFVELFNPQTSPVSLKGKYLAYYSSNREINNPYRLWEIEPDFTIPPKSHFLIAVFLEEGSTLSFNWQILTKEKKPYSKPQISQNGAIGIFNFNPKERGEEGKIDLVGWGKTNVFEGAPIELEEEATFIQRKTHNSSFQDTDNNLEDFISR